VTVEEQFREPSRKHECRSWKRATGPLAFFVAYLGLVAISTFPMILRLGSDLAGGGSPPDDSVPFFWNNWWIHRAIFDLRVTPYITDRLLVPFRVDLRLHALGLLYGLLSSPLVPLLGPLRVVNLQLLATPVLNGCSVFLLVRRLFERVDVAALCGAAICVCPAIDFHLAMGRPSCAAIWTVVLSLFFCIRLVESPRWGNGLGFAASLVGVLTVDPQMPIFAAALLVPYLFGEVVTRPGFLVNRKLWAQVLLALLILAYPFRVLYLRPFLQTKGYTVPDPSEALAYSISPSMLAQPRDVWEIYGFVLPLGFAAALALVKRLPGSRYGVPAAAVGLLLTLGPVLAGTRIPLPFAMLRAMPGLSQFRTPYRFQMPAALGMALALAAVLTRALGALERRWAGTSSKQWATLACAASIGLAIVVDTVAHRLVVGFDTHRFPQEAVYGTIAADPDDAAVLEVPFGVRCGTNVLGRGDDLMFYQTIHGKRLLNGYLSRIPISALEYYRRSPALMFLGNEAVAPEGVAADLESKIRELGIGFIVIHPERMDRDRAQALLTMLRARDDLEPLPGDSATLAFRVRPHRGRLRP
jgi:hypothetical protein